MIDKVRLDMKMVEQGYSQRALAKEMCKSKNTINAIFTGKRQPKLDEIDKMCDILRIIDPLEKVEIFLS